MQSRCRRRGAPAAAARGVERRLVRRDPSIAPDFAPQCRARTWGCWPPRTASTTLRDGRRGWRPRWRRLASRRCSRRRQRERRGGGWACSRSAASGRWLDGQHDGQRDGQRDVGCGTRRRRGRGWPIAPRAPWGSSACARHDDVRLVQASTKDAPAAAEMLRSLSRPAGARSTPPGCMRAYRRSGLSPTRSTRCCQRSARRCDSRPKQPGGRGGGRRDRWAERGAAVGAARRPLCAALRRARRHLLPALPDIRMRRRDARGGATCVRGGRFRGSASPTTWRGRADRRAHGGPWVRPPSPGVYNALTRGVEAELTPLLHELGRLLRLQPARRWLLTGKPTRALRRRLGRPFHGTASIKTATGGGRSSPLDGVRRMCAAHESAAAARRCPWRTRRSAGWPTTDAALRRRPDPRCLVRLAARRISARAARPAARAGRRRVGGCGASRRRPRRAMTARVSRVPSSAAGLPPPPRPPPRRRRARRRTRVGHRRGCRRQRCRGLAGVDPPPPSVVSRCATTALSSSWFQRRPT